MTTQKSNNGLFVLIILSIFITCGLAIPVWILVGIVKLIVEIRTPAPIQPVIKPVIIYPSNEFCDDWEFKIYPLESDENG